MPKKASKKLTKKSMKKSYDVAINPSQMTRYIKNTINGCLETKHVSLSQTLVAFNSGITSQSDFMKLLPQIVQGGGDNNRIGSDIQPIKLVVRGYVIYNSASPLVGVQNAGMLGARLFAFSDKSSKCYNNLDFNFSILDAGGTPQGFGGTALDFMTPHNNDNFTFYSDKKLKILKPAGGSNGNNSLQQIVSMHNSLYHPFTITIKANKMPKNLKYDEVLSNSYPLNFAPFIALGYSDLFNFSPDTISQQISMEYVSTLYFKDA